LFMGALIINPNGVEIFAYAQIESIRFTPCPWYMLTAVVCLLKSPKIAMIMLMFSNLKDHFYIELG
jgi:hypothetical protein